MDRSSLRASVVIEVATQEEPEDQKTYQIDFDDPDIPKNYVIDQVFSGENMTVYTLFEVPEDSSMTTDEHLSDTTSKTHDDCRFFHRDSTKRVMNQKKLNGFKQNVTKLDSEEPSLKHHPKKEKRNESFYCPKHLSGDYDILTPQLENSEVKAAYRKSTVSRSVKPTKFKAISKGVNTDIVQSPKIIQEIQKVVDFPFSKTEGKASEAKSLSYSNPLYEVIEMEMRQSFCSLSSCEGSRKHSQNSVPNFFLVPLLMKEDGVLSHFQSGDMIRKVVEGKDLRPPEKVSVATNTDFSELKTEEKKNQNTIDSPHLEKTKKPKPKREKTNSKQKLNTKGTILAEIKKLQGKLNALIKSIESDDFETDSAEDEAVDQNASQEEPSTVPTTPETLLTEPPPSKRNWDKLDDIPILSSCSYTECRELPAKKEQPKYMKEEGVVEIITTPTKSNSTSFISGENSCKSQIVGVHSASTVFPADKSREELQRVVSQNSIDWSELENRRGKGGSKSTTNIPVSVLYHKFYFVNGLKKSLSFDFKNDRLEVSYLKKIKTTSLKLEGELNKRILQKGEGNLKCEMGDEALTKPKRSKLDLLSATKVTENTENLHFDKICLDSENTLNKDEGDAKFVYPKQNLLSQMLRRKTANVEVHVCNTVTQSSKNLLSTGKNVVTVPEKFVAGHHSVEADLKVYSDSEKPTTPNKSFRKVNSTNCSVNRMKKEVKTVKKLNYQTNKVRFWEKISKPEEKDPFSPETIKQRSVSGTRKFTLKRTAELKLHMDRLMKSENSIGSKITSVEKSGLKDESKKKSEAVPKTNSLIMANKNTNTESGMALDKNEEVAAVAFHENSHQSIPNLPGVVVELLSEKPKSQELLCAVGKKKCANFKKTPNEVMLIEDTAKVENGESLDPEKPVVKSVWALTKVLLFEDGSKKIEILEASLTPPGYSLSKNSLESNSLD